MADGPVRVLLVEDDEDDYLLTRDLFAELPTGAYHLDRAADFASALHALDHCEHDVYLIDYRLGKHTGVELLAEATRRGCLAPMIMLTGQREREVDLLAMQAGAVDYLVKDRLDVAALDRSMRYALQQRQHQETVRLVNQQLEHRVRERTAELAQLNSALEIEIAERKRAEERLLHIDRKKDEFLATLAHELRNPLSPLLAAAQLVGMEPDNTTQVREMATVMTRQLEQLVRLIEDLLDVSRISEGKFQLKRVPVPLGEPLAAALDVSRPLIEAAAHTLHVTLPHELLVIDGDAVRISQIISNLLINAAKYTPAGGTIHLSVQRDRGEIELRVRDTGVGIPPEMQTQIFDLFTQLDCSATREQGGLGIGLTLVKTLVEMHGGTISVTSHGVGTGSEFTVRLPLAESVQQSSAAPVASPANQRSQNRVLVVDDSESAAHLLGRLLAKLQQEVRVVHSAQEALDLLPGFMPHLVISDVGMPGMSGLELAARIRGLKSLPQPVLVALTGYGQPSDRDRVLEAGFDQHCTKPIGLPALEELLAALSGQAN